MRHVSIGELRLAVNQIEGGITIEAEISPQKYTEARLSYHKSGERDAGVVGEAMGGEAATEGQGL